MKVAQLQRKIRGVKRSTKIFLAISDEIPATVTDHVVVGGMRMRQAGQRVSASADSLRPPTQRMTERTEQVIAFLVIVQTFPGRL